MTDPESICLIYLRPFEVMDLGYGLVPGLEVPFAHCGLFLDCSLLFMGFLVHLLLHFVLIGFDSD